MKYELHRNKRNEHSRIEANNLDIPPNQKKVNLVHTREVQTSGSPGKHLKGLLIIGLSKGGNSTNLQEKSGSHLGFG